MSDAKTVSNERIKIAQAYQAIGALAGMLGVLGQPDVQLLLDYFSSDAVDEDFDPTVTIDCRASEPLFEIGDRVFKHTGDYNVEGEVRGVIFKMNGELRYAVEIAAAGGGSFLHIYSAANLRKLG